MPLTRKLCYTTELYYHITMPSNTQYTQTRHLPSALRVESHLDVGDIWNPPTTEDGSSASEESKVELTGGRLPLFHGIVSQDTMKTAIKEGVKLDSAALALEFENRLLKDKLNDITRYNHSLVRHAFLNEDNLVAAVVRGEAANKQILQLSVQAINSNVSYRQRAAELDKIKKKLEAARLETADEASQALFAEQQKQFQELEVELAKVVVARDTFKDELEVVQDDLLQLRTSHDALLAEQAELKEA
eukprot:18198-Heterococcus_DN1.PRE.2